MINSKYDAFDLLYDTYGDNYILIIGAYLSILKHWRFKYPAKSVLVDFRRYVSLNELVPF